MQSTFAYDAAAICFLPRAEGAEIIGEVADLWFHNMVMLSHLEIEIEEVLDCLGNRFGISGLDEKASRGESRN